MGFKLTFLSSNVLGSCPGFPCDFISDYSGLLLGILFFKGFIFLLSLFPFIVSWKGGKVDGKSRIFFAFFACISFYLWLLLLIVNSTLCFGFLSHKGPCAVKEEVIPTKNESVILPRMMISSTEAPDLLLRSSALSTTTILRSPTHPSSVTLPPKNTPETTTAVPTPVVTTTTNDTTLLPPSKTTTGVLLTPPESALGSDEPLPIAAPLSANLFVRNISCTSTVPSNQNTAQLKKVTLLNNFIIIFLIIVLLANAREALTAKALYHKETLCNKDEVQKFLTSLVSKKPEVGHLVNCFHNAKNISGKSLRKVITFSAIENFSFDSWRDFSDVRLIDPSAQYPVIEIDILLNFFPGDHFTAEKYKTFVTSLTKAHSSKDSKITIDDYFHIEDQREWSFFIGNPEFIVPWWDRMPLKGIVSCGLLLGWPFRLRYRGRLAKHRIEIKKAVFCEEVSAPDAVEVITEEENIISEGGEPHADQAPMAAQPLQVKKETALGRESPVSIPPENQSPPLSNKIIIPSGGVSVFPPASATSSSVPSNCLRGAPNRSLPLTSPRTHLRETTKDIVTAVTHHDINGVNSTVALKDMDVKMSSISGYETYV